MDRYKVYVTKNNKKISITTEDFKGATALFSLLSHCCNDSIEEIKELMIEEGFENPLIKKADKNNQVLGIEKAF